MWVRKGDTIIDLSSVTIVGSRIELAASSGMRIILTPASMSGEVKQRDQVANNFMKMITENLTSFTGFLNLDDYEFE